jgi:hypothetical protein
MVRFIPVLLFISYEPPYRGSVGMVFWIPLSLCDDCYSIRV